MSDDDRPWIKCTDRLPDEQEIVITKIDDSYGVRNIQYLQLYKRNWFTPDGIMYVYYTPTHWKYPHYDFKS